MNSPQRIFLPVIMIILGIGLVGIGWVVNEPSETSKEVRTEIQRVVDEVSGSAVTTSDATPTTLVVVVPNGEVSVPSSVPPKIVVETGAAPQAPPPLIMPPALPAQPAPALQAPAPVFVSNRSSQPVSAPVAQEPVITVTATIVQEPVITVTATIPQALKSQLDAKATAAAAEWEVEPTMEPVIIVTATKTENNAVQQNVSGHCSEWTTEECVVYPTATPAPTYVPPTEVVVAPNTPLPPTPTPLPPTPTITPTPLPENNSIKSMVTRQGASSHAGTIVYVTNNRGVAANATTNGNGEFTLTGLDKGSYQIAAYSPNGSHLPACKMIDIGGNTDIVIPQTMLTNGGGFNTDETMNIGAAALVTIQFGLTIPEHMVPILDVNRDGTVDETDANALIADPSLLACQAW